MVDKICRLIGKFIIRCLKLTNYQEEFAIPKEEENINNFGISNNEINEWLYGKEAKEIGK